ncbi:LOW QUALITY PROTEIN: cholesterol 25-hydroxylase-like protein 1, member 2 [Cottoperca gobio]|uniref:LOW QUALITY PROTEIN: cholesterol 25-hydroxylase-like protein 1, member 2 n=1 Tax=Cottoperca gobio TaxID=56716 RepID=A0A6J2PV90_COTGO|nr:LOW QUALITY PROTEIN: cholesterol 25-hydroxylase-like protein 1, member 2 [Cottoperca gobio]
MDVADTSVDIWIRFLGNDSLLQPLWDSMRLNYTDYLRSPLFPIVLTVSSYFVLCLPFLVCHIVRERWPWVQQFKIQPSRRPAASTLLHCAGVTLYNHAFLVLPASVDMPPVDLPDQAPSLLELIAGVISNLLLFDLQYIIWHLIHHRIRWLYVTFHAIHHNYSSPFALATQCLGKHDVHHQKPNTNFAPHFSHWDKIFSTHADFSFSTAMK